MNELHKSKLKIIALYVQVYKTEKLCGKVLTKGQNKCIIYKSVDEENLRKRH